MATKFPASQQLQDSFHSLIPGGSHTYAKGDDQFPENCAPYIVRGKGCRVWDVDGNEFIEYGMGLRSVTLGHAYEPVVEAAHQQMLNGSNFTRPATIELECAEEMLELISGGEMIKFGKNGSDVTNAAVKLSRAHTSRDFVAICEDHPFFSVDDWFIGTTPMSAGIPKAVRDLTLKFRYNDIASIQTLFDTYPDEIACLIMEPEKGQEPEAGFLQQAQKLCNEHGTVLILDEMITGFRWHRGGGQAYHDIVPDLSTFGKGMANGFSVSALVGKRELMQLGGLHHNKERVFLLSLTHGAETHCLAAARATIETYKDNAVIDHLWMQGARLRDGIDKSISEHKLGEHVALIGRPCCLVYATRDQDGQPSQEFRTLFLQETIRRGLLAPSFVVSYAHQDKDIDQTIDIVDQALAVYRRALDEGISKYLNGRAVRPVWRTYN